MPSANWRGTVGVIKPTYEAGPLVEFIRHLPDGVGVLPTYADVREHSQQGYLDAMDNYHKRVEELSKHGVDVIHPEGGPPFMVRGHKAEREVMKRWEDSYGIPIFTSGSSQTGALRALGISKFVGCTYFRDEKLNAIFSTYFTDAGFEVLAMEGMDTSPDEAKKVTGDQIYHHLKQAFLRHPGAQGIYLLGSGAWRIVDVIAAEEDLGVPVVHPVAARVWQVQKLLHLHQPLSGAGRLLAELPA